MHKQLAFLRRNLSSITTYLAIFFCCAFALAAILINLNRYWQFESGYYDFGIFDTAIWKVAHFSPPIIDHFIVPGKVIFADHFSPTIFLLSPLYWLTDKTEVIFIAQDIIVALSGYVLFLIAKKLTKSNLISISTLLTYFFFTGLQNATFFDFHELTIMTLFLMLAFWAIFNRKVKLFFLFLILTLGCKESLFLLGIGLSFFIFVTIKEWRKVAIASLFISVLWGITAIYVIIPYFSGSSYYYAPLIAPTIFDIAKNLVSPIIKVKTVWWTYVSFSLLPLLTPSLLPITVLNFVSRFLSPGSTRWDLGLHYSAEIAPTLAIGALLSLRMIKERVSHNLAKIVAVIMLIVSIVLFRLVFHGPIGLAFNRAFYTHTNNFGFLRELIQAVPPKGTVMAQNNLAANFTHRQVWILRNEYLQHKPDYIVMDLREGQNPNNFLGVRDLSSLFTALSQDQDYIVFYHHGDQYIFQNKSTLDQ